MEPCTEWLFEISSISATNMKTVTIASMRFCALLPLWKYYTHIHFLVKELAVRTIDKFI